MHLTFLKKGLFSSYEGLPREIYILFGARIVTCLGSFIQPLLTLILTQKLGFSASETGSFSAFLILTQAPAVIVGGKLADCFGRKRVLISCQMLGAAFYLLCGLFPSRSVMIPGLTLAADLYVASVPAYDAMTADFSAPGNRQASYSLIYLGINIGMMISPLFAGLLFQNYLSLMFLLDGGTTMVSSLLIAVMVREGDWRGKAGTETVGGGRRKNGGSVFRLLRTLPVLSLVILFSFPYAVTYAQWSFLLPLQFGDFYGKNGALDFSMESALNALVVVLFTPALTRLTRRCRPLRAIAFAGVLFSVAYVAFGMVRSMTLFLLAGAVFTFGEILESVHFRPYLADRTPPRYLGRVNSLFMFVQGSGTAFGPLFAGHLVGPLGYRLTWAAQAVFVVLGAAGTLALDRKEKRILPAEQESASHPPDFK